MSAADASTLRLALVGNPNCGKTALFNQLTGLLVNDRRCRPLE